MVPPDSLLVALVQQGVEAMGNITASAPTVGNHWGEPSGDNRSHDQAKKPEVMKHHRLAATGV
jgi:hypothetical protein